MASNLTQEVCDLIKEAFKKEYGEIIKDYTIESKSGLFSFDKVIGEKLIFGVNFSPLITDLLHLNKENHIEEIVNIGLVNLASRALVEMVEDYFHVENDNQLQKKILDFQFNAIKKKIFDTAGVSIGYTYAATAIDFYLALDDKWQIRKPSDDVSSVKFSSKDNIYIVGGKKQIARIAGIYACDLASRQYAYKLMETALDNILAGFHLLDDISDIEVDLDNNIVTYPILQAQKIIEKAGKKKNLYQVYQIMYGSGLLEYLVDSAAFAFQRASANLNQISKMPSKIQDYMVLLENYVFSIRDKINNLKKMDGIPLKVNYESNNFEYYDGKIDFERYSVFLNQLDPKNLPNLERPSAKDIKLVELV